MSDSTRPPSDDPFVANPYAPTAHVSPEAAAGDDVEAYRRRYLSHEASVKSIGTLYLLGAFLLVPMGAIMLIATIAMSDNAGQAEVGIMAGVAMFYLGIGLLQGFAGVGVRRLQGWARTVAVILSVIGLIGFPIGTLISAYFLYLLLSEKGKIVFSDHYKQVIEQTPHIKYRTSVIVWILLCLLVGFLGLAIVGAGVGN